MTREEIHEGADILPRLVRKVFKTKGHIEQSPDARTLQAEETGIRVRPWSKSVIGTFVEW